MVRTERPRAVFSTWGREDQTRTRNRHGVEPRSMSMKTPVACLFGILAVSLAGVVPAAAEVITLKGDMSASNEVPPNQSPATGAAEATFDTATKALTWTITYTGLTG